MNMLAIGGKHWPTTDEPAQDGKSRFQNREIARNYRNGDRDDSGSFLRSLQRQSVVPNKDRFTGKKTLWFRTDHAKCFRL